MSIIDSQKVLITGGGGFLGRAITTRLVDEGAVVTSFSRNRYEVLDRLGVRQIQGDIRDALAVEKALGGSDLVFHAAAQPGVWGPYEMYYRTNFVGTCNVIEACLRQGVRRLVYTSSPSVVFDGRELTGVDESAPYAHRFDSFYSQTKAMAEQAVRQAAGEGLQTIILRPHLIWGPNDNHLVPRIIARASKLRIVGDGRNRVDTTYIDNAAEAHLLAAQKLISDASLSGRVYFISQGEPDYLWEIVNGILHAAGLPPVRKSVPLGVAYGIGAVLETIYRIFHIQTEPPMTRFVASQLAMSHWFDIGAARRDLGYTPIVDTSSGMERLAAWFKSQPPTG